MNVDNPVHVSETEHNDQSAKAGAERGVIERYGIDVNRLDVTGEDRERVNWSLWDGLSDEQGPIPAFGPVCTDANGRILMSDEEHQARRDAAIRALAAIAKITDETDTDEVWDEVFRGLQRDS